MNWRREAAAGLQRKSKQSNCWYSPWNHHESSAQRGSREPSRLKCCHASAWRALLCSPLHLILNLHLTLKQTFSKKKRGWVSKISGELIYILLEVTWDLVLTLDINIWEFEYQLPIQKITRFQLWPKERLHKITLSSPLPPSFLLSSSFSSPFSFTCSLTPPPPLSFLPEDQGLR